MAEVLASLKKIGGNGDEIILSNPMVCTPFRNTTPAGGTLTFADDGQYFVVVLFASASRENDPPVVISGSMTILQSTPYVTTANNFYTINQKFDVNAYIVSATAGTEIKGSRAGSYSICFAVKID